MIMIIEQTELEKNARKSDICLACLADKEPGNVLCWNCYKYRTDITPYKDFHGSLEEYLDYMGIATPN